MPLSKAKPEHPSLDYERLRQEGIRHIENLATEIWTDFNVHDPGITLLEALCYAITDLGYRTRRIPMADLLAGPTDDKPFFTATEVLPSGPVTALDYRKLLIDIDGVKNAWLARQEDATLFFEGKDGEGNPIPQGLFPVEPVIVQFKSFSEKENEWMLNGKPLEDYVKGKILQGKKEEQGAYENRITALVTLINGWANDGLTLEDWEKLIGSPITPALTPSQADQLTLAQALLCEYGYFPLTIEEIPKSSETPPKDPPGLIRLDGLVKLYIDFDDDLDPANTSDVRRVMTKVMDRLYAHRGLCQDYVVPATAVPRTPVAVCLHLDVEDKPNEVEIAAEALWQIEQHLSLQLRFYTFQQLRAKGRRTDEIYNGPLLDHGFLDDQDVEAAILKKTIQHSDLTNAATVAGVKTVHELKVKVFADPQFGIKTNYDIPDGHRPQLDLFNSVIHITRDGVRREIKRFELEEPLRRRRILAENYAEIGGIVPPAGFLRPALTNYKSIQYDLPAVYRMGQNAVSGSASPSEQAQNRQLTAYLAFFDQIMAAYLHQLGLMRNLFSTNQTIRIGEDGKSILNQTYATSDALKNIPGLAELLDKPFSAESPAVQRDRLNRVLSHLLARFGETFSDFAVSLLRPDEGPEDDPFYRTFTTHLQGKADYLRNVPDLRTHLYRGYNYRDPAVWNTPNVAGIKKHIHLQLALNGSWHTQSLIPQPVYRLDVVQVRTKTGALQHQIVLKVLADVLAAAAKVAVSDLDIPLGGIPLRSPRYNSLKVAQDKRDNLYSETWNPANYSVGPHPKESNKQAVLFKVNDKEELYSDPINDEEAKKLLEYMRDLATFIPGGETEGFHVLEHILLRPNDPKDADTLLQLSPGCHPETAPVDPYSWWLTVVAPKWTVKFGDPRFQDQFEQAFRAEMPAHLAARFCWVGKEEMREFEERYQAWMIAKALCVPDDCKVTDEAKKLIEWLNENPARCDCDRDDHLKSPC